MDARTGVSMEVRTNNPKAMPLQLFQSWGHNNIELVQK